MLAAAVALHVVAAESGAGTEGTELKAHFEAAVENYDVVYYNGFDSEADLEGWTTSAGSSWRLNAGVGSLASRGLKPFSTINPESVYSLYHAYASDGSISVISTPDFVLPEAAKVRFYVAYNPIWLIFGNLRLYVCESAEGAVPVKVWDAFFASQEAATDDTKWLQHTIDLTEYAGKEVFFSFTYELDYGDDILLDDFEIIVPSGDGSSVEVNIGEAVQFCDLSSGEPEAWEWSFPGAVTESSSEQNPTVVYNTAGSYDVTLRVSKGGESDELVRTGYVVVRNIAPSARIAIPEGVYFSPEASLVVPLNAELTFRDASAGAPTAYSWSFPGTDIETSTEAAPTVKYIREGMYDVDLEVTNAVGTSATYIYGVKAGGKSLAWNIAADENEYLEVVSLGWYGNYGGSNWLDMEAFAEAFDAPRVPATITSVNIYFGSVTTVSPDAQITVSVALADADGLPGEVLASSTMPVRRLVDASVTYNDPTVFVLDKPAEVDSKFFITVAGFPNESNYIGDDDIAMYVLRRGDGGRNTAYHLLKEVDDNYEYTGEVKWYAQTDDPCSLAIAPRLEFYDEGYDSVALPVADSTEAADTEAVYYNLQGLRVDAANLTPGIYIMRRGATASKVMVR